MEKDQNWTLKQGGEHQWIIRCKTCGHEFPPIGNRDLSLPIMHKEILRCGQCQATARKRYLKDWAAAHKSHRAVYMRRYRRRQKHVQNEPSA